MSSKEQLYKRDILLLQGRIESLEAEKRAREVTDHEAVIQQLQLTLENVRDKAERDRKEARERETMLRGQLAAYEARFKAMGAS